MMPLSPIERMIDSACGLQPGQIPPPMRPSEPPPGATEALLEVAAAAKAWHRNHKRGAKRLTVAVKRWLELGG